MSEGLQSVVLCEGFHDRAFLKGWLHRLGCSDQLTDPFGVKLTRGQFGFVTPAGGFVRVAPARGDENVIAAIEPLLKERTTKPIDWLIVNLDCDASQDEAGSGSRSGRLERIVLRFRRQGEVQETGSGQYTLDDGTKLGVLFWETPDAARADLPAKQTLERLVCAALHEAYPERAKAVEAWLRTRPQPEAGGCQASEPKAFAWSHMAGWYSKHGCDEFHQQLWAVEVIALALEARLRASGAWNLASLLVAAVTTLNTA